MHDGIHKNAPVSKEWKSLIKFCNQGIWKDSAPRKAEKIIIKMCKELVPNELVACLNFLTGDNWTFEFIKRQDEIKQSFQQTFLKDINGTTVVIPYSGGIDSYVGLNLVKHDESEVKPFLVTVEFKKTYETRKLAFHTSHSLDKSDNRVFVAIAFSKLDHPEISFRSRTFIFFSIAAIVANLIGSQRILIPESGQGALGTALTTLGNEPTFINN